MAGFARSERLALADLMLAEGPDAPTRCEGWTARDLAAHLVLRERRPDAALGLLAKPLSGYTQSVQRRLRDRPWPSLVGAVRSGPPGPLRALDEQMNLVEMFVHHEDVRRARPEWSPRSLDAAEEQALWARLRTMARLWRRRLPVAVTLDAPGYGSVAAGPGAPQVTVTGPPGELLLFIFGRQDVARVELSGPDTAVARLKSARLGF